MEKVYRLGKISRVGHHSAVAQDNRAAGVLSDVLVMRHQDARNVQFVMKPPKPASQFLADFGIQCAERFIKQEQLKKGPLTEAEWAVMRTHTLTGEDICRPIKCLSQVLPIIRSHHERWDGSGYPDGLAGDKIPLLARVLQFADIYDALMSVRSYKPAMTSAAALRIMQEETDRGWHDPELMRLFLRLRHDAVREVAESNAASWQDVQVMRDSLANLRSSLLRY